MNKSIFARRLLRIASQLLATDESNDNAKEISKALESFVTYAQSVLDKHMDKHFPTVTRPVLSVEMGKRYARIVRQDSPNSRSVHCFVDMTNGDILKADSWKTPAKHARGSVLDPSTFVTAVTPWGATTFR